MANDLNKFIGAGRISKDPELRDLNGFLVCEVSMALNENYTNKSGAEVKKTAFVTLKFFNKLASAVQKWVKVGQQIIICGKIAQENWIDKETGGKRSKLVIECNEFHFCGNKDDSATPRENKPPQQRPVSQSVNGRTTQQQTHLGPANDFPDFPEDGPVGDDGAPF